MKINRRVIELSILLYFVAILPISYIHESGHAAMCGASAHQASIHFTFGGLYTTCIPDLYTFAFYITGPAYGLTASLAVLFAGIYLARNVIFLPKPVMTKTKSDDGKPLVVFKQSSLHAKTVRPSLVFFGLILIVVGIAQSADQVSKVVLEGFYTKIYESNDSGMNALVTVIQLSSLIVPMLLMSRIVQQNQFLAEGGVMLDALILAWLRNPLIAISLIKNELELRRLSKKAVNIE